jgi:hypothetical protein
MWFVKPLLSVGRFVISIFAFVVSRRNLISNNGIINLMSPQDWAGLTLTLLTIVTIVAGGIRWLVKHYLNELKPNSGSSLKDSVNRLEEKTDKLFDLLIEHIKDHNKK